MYFRFYSAYLIKKDDCETMARAYVNDISQFLDITNKENVKILKDKTLIWADDLLSLIPYYLRGFYGLPIENST